MSDMRSDLFYHAVSLIALLLIWQVAAVLFDTNLLPTPLTVARVLIEEIESGQLPYNLGVTLARLAVSFMLAMLLGTAIGID